MNLPRMVARSLRQHLLSTLVTSLSIALAGGLLMSVWVVKDQARETFTRVNAGFDAVLGARASALQLVLNAIFHLESSPGNLPWEDYEAIRKHPAVAAAIPIAVGDNYRGFRLVGTIPEFFQTEYAPGLTYRVAPGGRLFDPSRREAVAGSFAAQRLGLRPGDEFHPYHGLLFDEKSRHAETFLLVGVLEPSNTPADRVIWIPLAGLQRMSGHDPAAATEVSAVLVKLRPESKTAGFLLDQTYNKRGNRLTFAWPISRIMIQLFDKLAWFDRVLTLVAYLILLVAIGSVLASIYNSMSERRREIAILRSLGAHRRTVFAAVVLEAGSIGALGMALAFPFYLIILSVIAAVLRQQTGVVLSPLEPHWILAAAPPAVVALSALAGIVPAWKGYRTEVAAHLVPTS